jgi:predicted Zn-dependent protease
MRAKLYGFLEPLERVLQVYPASDDSLPARYARTIAHYQAGDIENALESTEALIAEMPEDPYFRELKGQMLFEYGRLGEALPAYQEAVRLSPRSAQLRLGLAQVQIETNRPELNDAALEHIEATLREEPDNSFAWRLAAVAYGRKGDVGMTALALAERALAQGHAKEARDQAVRARDLLPAGSPGALRAADIEGLAVRLIKKN